MNDFQLINVGSRVVVTVEGIFKDEIGTVEQIYFDDLSANVFLDSYGAPEIFSFSCLRPINDDCLPSVEEMVKEANGLAVVHAKDSLPISALKISELEEVLRLKKDIQTQENFARMHNEQAKKIKKQLEEFYVKLQDKYGAHGNED